MTPIQRALHSALDGRNLSRADMVEVVGEIMDGKATPAQIGGFLVALRAKGEHIDELVGAATAMRARALPLGVPNEARAIDTCGTGGDGAGTVNISTLAAILLAACGATVAKHGNRALSSKCGSADVLEAFGVAVDTPPEIVERSIKEVGIGFAFAPRFHAATKHAAVPRRELGIRTIFNLLGPLTNPANVPHQIVGVFDPRWCQPMAAALGALGLRRAAVVCGSGGGGNSPAATGLRGAASMSGSPGSIAVASTSAETGPRGTPPPRDATRGVASNLVATAPTVPTALAETGPTGTPPPRDATRGGVNGPASPGQRGRESPLWIDELSVRGETVVALWNGAEVQTFTLSPRSFGCDDVDPAGLAGGDAAHNAAILLKVLANHHVDHGERLEAVLQAAAMTAALGLELLDSAPFEIGRLPARYDTAITAVKSGAARLVLYKWCEVSRAAPDDDLEYLRGLKAEDFAGVE